MNRENVGVEGFEKDFPNRMIVGRLAPSPTGAQHLGNARTFLIAWLSIRQQKGHLILRIEDIDSPRVKEWAFQQAIDDLNWLGLTWDEGPDSPGPAKPYVQSERLDRYRAALTRLMQAEAVYPCSCSRSDVEESASAPHEISDGPIYGGTCRFRKVTDRDRIEHPYCWRFRVHPGSVHFEDGCLGLLDTEVSESLGDFVVYRNDDSPAYQLSVVVDDHEMGITEVVRGDDLVPSTFRQLNLYKFFGWEPPRFFHVPLVVGPDGRRLAKRHGDTRLSHFRELDVPPNRIVGLLAFSLGWIAEPAEMTPDDLISIADLKSIPSQPWVFDDQHLKWLVN